MPKEIEGNPSSNTSVVPEAENNSHRINERCQYTILTNTINVFSELNRSIVTDHHHHHRRRQYHQVSMSNSSGQCWPTNVPIQLLPGFELAAPAPLSSSSNQNDTPPAPVHQDISAADVLRNPLRDHNRLFYVTNRIGDQQMVVSNESNLFHHSIDDDDLFQSSPQNHHHHHRKRKSNPAVEKRYRNSINDKINELKKLLHESTERMNLPQVQNLHKSAVLGRTIEYIRYLERENAQLTSTLSDLRTLLHCGTNIAQVQRYDNPQIVMNQIPDIINVQTMYRAPANNNNDDGELGLCPNKKSRTSEPNEQFLNWNDGSLFMHSFLIFGLLAMTFPVFMMTTTTTQASSFALTILGPIATHLSTPRSILNLMISAISVLYPIQLAMAAFARRKPTTDKHSPSIRQALLDSFASDYPYILNIIGLTLIDLTDFNKLTTNCPKLLLRYKTSRRRRYECLSRFISYKCLNDISFSRLLLIDFVIFASYTAEPDDSIMANELDSCLNDFVLSSIYQEEDDPELICLYDTIVRKVVSNLSKTQGINWSNTLMRQRLTNDLSHLTIANKLTSENDEHAEVCD